MQVLDNKEKILENLIRKYNLYKKQAINYKKVEETGSRELYFKDMYEEYREQYSEKEFAEILGISSINYRTGLKAKNRVCILNNRKLQDDSEEIKKKLKKQYQLDKSYSNFLSIYEKYKTYFTETELYRFLDITNSEYRYMKEKARKEAKTQKNVEIDMKIIRDLAKKYNIFKGQSIAYEQKEEEHAGPYFKELYMQYEDKYSEIEFAEMLGINRDAFKVDMIYGEKKLRILNNIKLETKEKNEILESVIRKYDLYKGQIINCSQFYKMYEEYKLVLTGLEFAEMLGISRKLFYSLKVRNARILMNRCLSNEQRQIVLERIIKEYDLRKKQNIKYEYKQGDEQWYNGLYFKEMHNEYKDYFTIIEFADLLQIYNNGETLSIKYNGKCAVILSKRNLTETDKEEILNLIVNKYEGIGIKYEDDEKISYRSLYEPYKSKVTEREFAQHIGICESSLEKIKYNKLKCTIIKNRYIMNKMEKLRQNMEKRFYTDIEIKNILDEYNITLKQFISYGVNKAKIFVTEKGIEKYKIAINRNHGLYIGHMPISNQWVEENYEDLQRITGSILKKIRLEHNIHISKLEDFRSDILTYIIQTYGDIVNNFGYDNDMVLGLIYGYASKIAPMIFSKETYYHNYNYKRQEEYNYDKKARRKGILYLVCEIDYDKIIDRVDEEKNMQFDYEEEI